jgi:hypothetical protein
MQMIPSFKFSPSLDTIQSFKKSSKEISSYASDLNGLSCEEHELEKNIMSISENLSDISNEIQDFLVAHIEEDLEQKTTIYLTLVSHQMIDDIFPFDNWISIFQKEKTLLPFHFFDAFQIQNFQSHFENSKNPNIQSILSQNIHFFYSSLLIDILSALKDRDSSFEPFMSERVIVLFGTMRY